MSNPEIDLDLTEIHFDFFCKVGGTPQMLQALIAAQEDNVRRWSSCPSFGPFIHKLFVQPQDVSLLGPIHPTGCISIDHFGHSSCFINGAVEAPIDNAASIALHGPSDCEPFPFPISKILAKFYEYGQYELHKVRMAIRSDNKTIKYVDVQAFPSENFPEARNKNSLQKVNAAVILEYFYRELLNGRDQLDFNIQTAFHEHLEVIGNRMRDNGYNIKIHVPDEVIASEVDKLLSIGLNSDYGTFNLGAYMDMYYFMPLIGCAVLGTIKDGEFAVFELDGTGDVQLRRNHQTAAGAPPRAED